MEHQFINKHRLTRKCTCLGFKMMYSSRYEQNGVLGLVDLPTGFSHKNFRCSAP
jgi:hypothetical protein